MKKPWRRVGVGSLAALLVVAGVWVTASSQIGNVAESEISSSSPESGPDTTGQATKPMAICSNGSARAAIKAVCC